MSHIRLLKEIILAKTHNIVPDKKAKQLCDLIEKHLATDFPAKNLSEALTHLSKEAKLPPWLLSAVLVHETYFFRHPEQYAAITDFLIKRRKAQSTKAIQALCIGCSTGQEAYSLAMLSPDLFVTGVDLDPEVVSSAKTGRYDHQDIERTPPPYQKLLRNSLQKETIHGEVVYKVVSSIHKRVRFMVGDAFRISPDTADLILVRNSLIYFPEKERETLITKLISQMTVGGLLMIGQGELFPTGLAKNKKLQINGASILERMAA